MVELYRRRKDDGALELKELDRGMFSDAESFDEAVNLAYADGFVDREDLPPPGKL